MLTVKLYEKIYVYIVYKMHVIAEKAITVINKPHMLFRPPSVSGNAIAKWLNIKAINMNYRASMWRLSSSNLSKSTDSPIKVHSSLLVNQSVPKRKEYLWGKSQNAMHIIHGDRLSNCIVIYVNHFGPPPMPTWSSDCLNVLNTFSRPLIVLIAVLMHGHVEVL